LTLRRDDLAVTVNEADSLRASFRAAIGFGYGEPRYARRLRWSEAFVMKRASHEGRGEGAELVPLMFQEAG
jgi:hypothetical protein